MRKFLEKIMSPKGGPLNEYMAHRLESSVCEDGMTDDVFSVLEEDAISASELGVTNDDDYKVYFFISRFAKDLIKDMFDINLPKDKENDLKKYMFGKKNEYDMKDLIDFRILAHDWLKKNVADFNHVLDKQAHPNTTGRSEHEREQDLGKWVQGLKDIYALVHEKGHDKGQAEKIVLAGWDFDEKIRFMSWMRYYEQNTPYKYKSNMEKNSLKSFMFRKEADLLDPDYTIPQGLLQTRDKSPLSLQSEPQKTRRELAAERALEIKRKMRSRIYALKRLVDQYSDQIPGENISKLLDEIHSLEKSIAELKSYAAIRDCIFRSAGKINEMGFVRVASQLEKMAEEENTIVNFLPKAESDLPDMANKKPKFDMITIINRLEGLSKKLKSRDMIRELASVDILLNEMGVASYFPELTDAQAKLIEAFGYASNKIEGVIAKLRGTGTRKEMAAVLSVPPAELGPATKAAPLVSPAAPTGVPAIPPGKPMETGEIMDKPVKEVKTELPIGIK